MTQEARERGTLIDASFGRKTKAVLVMDSGHIVLSALPPEAVGARFSTQAVRSSGMEEEEDEE